MLAKRYLRVRGTHDLETRQHDVSAARSSSRHSMMRSKIAPPPLNLRPDSSLHDMVVSVRGLLDAGSRVAHFNTASLRERGNFSLFVFPSPQCGSGSARSCRIVLMLRRVLMRPTRHEVGALGGSSNVRLLRTSAPEKRGRPDPGLKHLLRL